MINKPKGTYDVFENEGYKWKKLVETINEVFNTYNYKYIRTPIFESSSLFKRKNEFSEMVKKQTYDFLDKSNRKQTLRPEGTAPVIRAIIENKLYTAKNPRFFYYGPYFRYERPQKGRFREFYQFGVEALGDENYLLDSEIIILATRILDKLNIKYLVKINTLGNNNSRIKYEKSLVSHFEKDKENLCADCQERLKNNPLRILDCKVDKQSKTFEKAPKISKYLDKESKEYFDKVTSILKKENINFEIDSSIVRGLDYYTGIVFEIVALKNETVLAGGGRYQNLSKELGGPDIGGVGFAFGCERVLDNISFDADIKPKVYIISDEKEQDYAFSVLEMLRKNNIKTLFDFKDRNFSKKLKEAFTNNPEYVIFIKEEELKNKTLTVKNIKTEKQEVIKKDNILKYLEEKNASK